MVILETERLILRTWTLEDQDAAFEIWGDKEVVRFLGLSKPMTKSEISESIKRGIDHQMKYGYQHWAVELKENQAIIGVCGFNSFHQTHETEKSVEIVFHFKKVAWGRGYASEAAEGAVKYAKQKMKIDRIVAGVDDGNIRSINILMKLNFEYLGLVYFDDTKQLEPMYALWIKNLPEAR